MPTFWDRLRGLATALHIYLPSIVFLLISYVMFFKLGQARDVLTISAENSQGSLLLCLSGLIWAYFSWYSSRVIVYNHKAIRNEDFGISGPKRWIPRLVGSLSLAIPAFGMLSLCYVNFDDGRFYYILGGYAVLLIALSIWVGSNKNRIRFKAWVWASLLIIALALVVINGTVYLKNYQTNLSTSAIWMLVVSLLFLLFTAVRNRKAQLDQGLWSYDFLFIQIRLPKFEKPWFIAFNIVALFVFTFYIIGVFHLPMARWLGPYSVPLLAFIFLLGAGNLITFLGQQIRWNLHLTLWVLAFLISNIAEQHWVRMEKGSDQLFANRPGLEDYYSQVIKPRLLEDTIAPPLVFVLADGGASRSGYWTSSVLGKLTDEYGEDFTGKVIAMSGASGGSVGISAYFSLLSSEDHPDSYQDQSRDFFANDFLSFTLLRMIGPDMFRYLIPFRTDLMDRAGALEYSMENGTQNTICSAQFARDMQGFQSSFTRRMGTSNHLPLLLLNTTRLNAGKPGVVSFIRLNSITNNRLDPLAIVDRSARNSGYNDLHMSSAAILSSRFPYINPAGRIDSSYFIDGGYFDNSGAGIIHELVLSLDALAAKDTVDSTHTLADRLNYVVLHLKNSKPKKKGLQLISPIMNDLATPFIGMSKVTFSQTALNNSRFKEYLRRRYPNDSLDQRFIEYNLFDQYIGPDNAKGEICDEGFSMSWVISEIQRNRMDAAVTREIEAKNPQLKRALGL